MEYGRFIEEGKKYEILTPFTPTSWKNPLYNDEYYAEVDQTLQGGGYLVKDYNRTPLLEEYRYFYLADRDGGEVWNPNYVPLAKTPDTYSCVHGIWDTELRSVQRGIETVIRVTVPPRGSREVWSVSLKNLSSFPRSITFYPVFGIYDHGVMGGECVYDEEAQILYKYAFPYHTLYEEKEKAEKEKAYTYLFSDETPVSWEMSRRRFFGSQGERGIPEGVRNGRLTGIRGEAEAFCGAFSFEFTLAPGEIRELFLEAGAAVSREEILERKERFGKEEARREFRETGAFWEKQFDGFHMETSDENLNAFGNYWLKKQVTLLTRQNRGSSYCPVRNQLQDAMGYAMICPEASLKYLTDVLRLQRRDGFIQQWHDTTGAPPRGLCLLNHTDGPVWLVICGEVILRQVGRGELLQLEVPYTDGGTGAIIEHMKAALFYLIKQVGSHGLCLMGDGDWNDPINGVGREGRGESIWLSMALVYAIKVMLPYLRESAPEDCRKLSEAEEQLRENINAYGWSGRWYAAALHDDGTPIGDEKDRLFLNTQSWAILSGTAEGEKRKILEETLKELETPFGPLILSPAFQGWDPRWGRISIKKSGTTENGSVYCHASMFLAFARALQGDGGGLYEVLWRTLPTNPENPPEKNLQIPVYLANYYYGLRGSANFGRSSGHYGTGTASWMLMLLMEELMGIRPAPKGIRIQPCLPEEWDHAACRKVWRNAVYEITIKRERPASGKESTADQESGKRLTAGRASVYVDGMLCREEVLPYEAGKTYQVEIIL